MFFLDKWKLSPFGGGSLDIPFEWIDDIIQFVNLRDSIEDDDNPYYYAPEDAYDDTIISDDGDDVVVNFGF